MIINIRIIIILIINHLSLRTPGFKHFLMVQTRAQNWVDIILPSLSYLHTNVIDIFSGIELLTYEIIITSSTILSDWFWNVLFLTIFTFIFKHIQRIIGSFFLWLRNFRY